MPPKKVSPPKAASKPGAKAVAAKGTAAKGAAAKGAPAKKGSNTAVPVKKGSGDKAQAEKKYVWTEKDDMARKIQTKYRQFRAKKELDKRKKEKIDYEELMDKLEKEAFLRLVKMEQEEAERLRQKEEEERRQRAEAKKRMKRMLESSFDGDNDTILAILKEVEELDNKKGVGTDVIGRALRNKHLYEMINCEDANENTPVSEAASGGHVDTIKLLLERGAEPNCIGQFSRTPLYRAAFAGHLEACQVLLQNGADPRIYAQDGQTPEQIASVPAIAEMLAAWDISQTERLLQKLERAKEQRAEEDRKRHEAETQKIEGQVEEADKEYKTKQKLLDRAYCELEKRITEHDMATASGFERTDITLQTIHDAEADLEIAKLDCEKARDKLSQLRLRLREQQTGGAGVNSAEDMLPGIKVMVRDLDDVLMRDVGNKIHDSGKWPLIIDTSGQASTFLRYRDTNYINALRPADMELENIRRVLLGAIRFGKPFILDFMEVDMYDTCVDIFNRIQPGLMASIMDKTITQEEKYLKLVKESDGADYDKNKFNDYRLSNFKFYIISKSPFPKPDLIETMYPISVTVPT